MAKIEKASEDIIKFVEEIINKTTLPTFVNFRVLKAENQKPLVRVSKASSTVEYLSGCKDLVIVYINEDIFDLLEDKTKSILIEDAINTVSYALEKGKINIMQPQLNITIDGFQTHGVELVNAAEIAYNAYRQIKEEQKEKEKEEKLKKKNKGTKAYNEALKEIVAASHKNDFND